MKTIKIGSLVLGGGATAICAPLVGSTETELMEETLLAAAAKPDLAEWRADYFEGASEPARCVGMLRMLHDLLPCPVLFTLRASFEGGAQVIPREMALAVYLAVIESGYASIIDMELANEPAFRAAVLSAAAKKNVYTILSSHDFERTPLRAEIVSLLCRAQERGADIVKIAVTPQSAVDVLTLLAALEEFSRVYAEVPTVAVSMGRLGAVTRVAGGVFGSALTFGALKQSSAPGQFDVESLRAAMRTVL